MSHRSQLILYNLSFVFWVFTFLLVGLYASGMDIFGKTRAFGGFATAGFICFVVFFYWRISVNMRSRSALNISTGIWVTLIFMFFAPLFLALFFEPPYEYIASQARAGGMDEDNVWKLVNGPAVSASTEYVRWVDGWRVYRDAVLFGI